MLKLHSWQLDPCRGIVTTALRGSAVHGVDFDAEPRVVKHAHEVPCGLVGLHRVT